ncbi:MAG: AAA domain-containing protein, partial [Rhodopirellula sp. JB044]|uniref:AAA domain-containing protein n=1 Tax=Rhodopirellula sp. JB044 TaxID=3342844 RepID=UPI00370B5B24
FDLIVIDEACQSTEGGMWQAILRADRLIIAGDHCQLPPTVLSDEAAAIGMRDSLMQRLVHRFGEPVYRRLTVQYRMHEAIMRFSSDHFYDGSLIADASVRSHLLCDLPDIEKSPLTETPLLWIDTAGAGYDEQLEPDGQSKLNPGEANVIVELVRQLEAAGIEPSEIAIIAPYAAQVRLLRSRLDMDGLEVDTVDGFQGREKEVVLLTMVRSNPDGIIGFLADRRRSNVAMTRAKRKLIMVGDSATLCTNEFYADVLKYFEDANAYQSVFEFQTLVTE